MPPRQKAPQGLLARASAHTQEIQNGQTVLTPTLSNSKRTVLTPMHSFSRQIVLSPPRQSAGTQNQIVLSPPMQSSGTQIVLTPSQPGNSVTDSVADNNPNSITVPGKVSVQDNADSAATQKKRSPQIQADDLTRIKTYGFWVVFGLFCLLVGLCVGYEWVAGRTNSLFFHHSNNFYGSAAVFSLQYIGLRIFFLGCQFGVR
jgi:hypothetical protein